MGGSKRIQKAWRRFLKRHSLRMKKSYVLLAALAVIVSVILIERTNVHANYTGLLNTIAEGESKGNYNAYFGHAHNTKLRFTDMTVGEVLEWQEQFVAQGNPSSAVGKYQFIQPTLEGLVQEMRISKSRVFNEALQDKLAIRLLERRGVREYLRGHISREEFAHNLSKEWAALPRVLGDNPSASYYAGDGLNKSHISIDQVFAAIESLKATEQA